ncbi:MAG TPA: TetR/AcrR family transcriptional regulator [Candidatus Sulfotelmatobacter sp.]|nr:TetR/AcrR family transcriptional regulator [Candidatus Sulfotelmatobacter sp.]
MPKLGEERREERRRQLLDAAWRCAARKGYHDTTVDDICAEAGVSKGAFYGYFDSKQSLLVALLEEDGVELDRIMARLDSTETRAVQRLREFSHAMLERGADSGRVQISSDIWAVVLTEGDLHDRVAAVIGRRRAVLKRWIEEAVGKGELYLDNAPANAFASLLLALGDGLTLHGSLDPLAFRWRNIARALDALLTRAERDQPG